MGGNNSTLTGGTIKLDKDDKNNNIKLLIENIYNDIMRPENIENTLTNTYCNNLKVFLADDVLKKYSTDLLKQEGKNLVLGIEVNTQNSQLHTNLCDKLGDYYVKKVNLIGSIINTINILHNKLDRLNNGGVCYSDNKGAKSKLPYKINIIPTLPLDFKFDNKLILLDSELDKMRNDILKSAGIKDVDKNISLIEIMDKATCESEGGIWLSTRAQLVNNYIIPADSDLSYNKDWTKEFKKLELEVYKNITKLIEILNLLVEERVEPKMVNGVEQRVKIYRDRLITQSELDKHVLAVKSLIIKAFVSIDTQYLILNSKINIKTSKDVKKIEKLKSELLKLDSKGKLSK